MNINEQTFINQEKNFKEKTGKDFTTLYKKYYPKLIFFIHNICKDKKKSEDISTDSFMMALEKINLYDKSKAQFSTWLFTIAKNITYQELKKQKKTISLDKDYDYQGTTIKDFISQDLNEEHDEDKYKVLNKKATIMKTNIKKLKEPYKTVITMREIDKMAYKDIAHKLDKNLSTIKSQIRNGRMLLIKKSERELRLINKLYPEN